MAEAPLLMGWPGDDVLDLDDPSSWCRMIEGHLRGCAQNLRTVEEKVIETDLRPAGERKENARRAARAHLHLLRRSVQALLEHLDALEERLP